MIWRMSYTLDKKEYYPLEDGVMLSNLTNEHDNKILVTKVVLKFAWMKNSYWYKNCNIEIKSGERVELPKLYFDIGLKAEKGTHHYEVGAQFKILEDGWSEPKLSYGKKGGHISIKKAPSRDFDVFISHSNHTNDKKLLKMCIESLENCGFTPKMAELDPKAGFPLWEKIRNMIKSSDAFFLLWTGEAASSGDIREEIGITLGAEKFKIVPLVEEGVEPQGSLRGLEYISFNRENFYEGLTKGIKNLLEWSDERLKSLKATMPSKI